MRSLLLGIVLLCVLQQAWGQDRSINVGINVSRSPPSKPDCKLLEEARNGGPVQYSHYAQCVLRNYDGVFNSLYSRYLRDTPPDRQMADVAFELKFQVDDSGFPEHINLTAGAVPSDDFLSKVKTRLGLIKLAPPDGGARDVVYKFEFSKDSQ